MVDRLELRNPGGKEAVSIVFDGTNVSFINSDTGEELIVLAASSGASDAVNDLTEDGGAIGGTNDGDIPDLTSPSAALNAEGIRELATMVNTILEALRTAGIIGGGPAT